MTSLLEFFYDGRKLFLTLMAFIIFLIVFFVFKKEMVPYSVYLLLFSSYFGELNPMAFLIFYYFLTAYIYSSLMVTTHDLVTIVIKGDLKNV
jgi:hypothetical protein